MLKNDKWIKEVAEQGMITPFVPELVRAVEYDPDPAGLNRPPAVIPTRKVISFGVSSTGYDVRLSPKEFMIFRHVPGTIVNPKRFNPRNLEPVDLQTGPDGDYFVIPAHSYGLCVTLERIQMPPNVTGLLLNKSTMVRCGVVLPATVIEPNWAGHITIEVSNSSDADVMLFAAEGIAQLLFFDAEFCEVNYSQRAGKYMNQPEQIVMARV